MKNSNEVYREVYKNHLIAIEVDDDPINPREDCYSCFGKLATWHRKYVLGDEQPSESPIEYMRSLVSEYGKEIENITTYQVWAEFQEREDENNYWDVDTYIENLTNVGVQDYFKRFYVMLPVYMYDHSGITINTAGYSCHWDSGQLGFIYVSKKDAMKNWNETEWSQELEDKTIKLLRAEVESYDDFLTGNVYGYSTYSGLDAIEWEDEEGIDKDDLELEDSCWSYYPDHQPTDILHGSKYRPDYQVALDEARSMVDWTVKDNYNKAMERATYSEGIGE